MILQLEQAKLSLGELAEGIKDLGDSIGYETLKTEVEELENKTFERLYYLIWAIAVTANDDFPLIKDGSADTGGDQRGSITRGRLHWLIPHRCN